MLPYSSHANSTCQKTTWTAVDGISEETFLWLKSLLSTINYPLEIDRCFFEKDKNKKMIKPIDFLIY